MERLPGVLSEMSGCDVVRIDGRNMTGEELRNSVIEKLLAARYTRHNARSTDSGIEQWREPEPPRAITDLTVCTAASVDRWSHENALDALIAMTDVRLSLDQLSALLNKCWLLMEERQLQEWPLFVYQLLKLAPLVSQARAAGKPSSRRW